MSKKSEEEMLEIKDELLKSNYFRIQGLGTFLGVERCWGLSFLGTKYSVVITPYGLYWFDEIGIKKLEPFEKIFEDSPDHIKDWFLFHLDLFR